MSAVAATPDPIAVYRDDGPIAREVGDLGRSLPLPGPVLALAALVPLLVVVVLGGSELSHNGAAVVLVWVLLAGGASCGVAATALIGSTSGRGPSGCRGSRSRPRRARR